MNQTNRQTSNGASAGAAESQTVGTERPIESLVEEALPPEEDIAASGDPLFKELLRLRAMMKFYMAARPAPTLVFQKFPYLPREPHQRRPRPRRPARRKTVEAQK